MSVEIGVEFYMCQQRLCEMCMFYIFAMTLDGKCWCVADEDLEYN